MTHLRFNLHVCIVSGVDYLTDCTQPVGGAQQWYSEQHRRKWFLKLKFTARSHPV